MIKGSVHPKTVARDELAMEYIRDHCAQTGRFPTVRELANALHLSSSSMAALVLTRLEERGLIEHEGRHRRIVGQASGMSVPILGTIAAGQPLMAIEQIEGYLPIDPAMAKGRELFALKVRGESMINAGILPGDTVLLEKVSTVEDGQIAAVWLEDAATVKRVYREAGRIRLQPENDGMEPIYTERCEVLGRVIGLVRNYE
jgi:repressor LexA